MRLKNNFEKRPKKANIPNDFTPLWILAAEVSHQIMTDSKTHTNPAVGPYYT